MNYNKSLYAYFGSVLIEKPDEISVSKLIEAGYLKSLSKELTDRDTNSE